MLEAAVKRFLFYLEPYRTRGVGSNDDKIAIPHNICTFPKLLLLELVFSKGTQKHSQNHNQYFSKTKHPPRN
ncbi:unnamed protein product [Lactuca virosa]|uniref:Uncharacterized protein n=1 Tax=Lactuca virosa TaxID=75947 RepID=A0AAU9NH07_9ASTR|nr:unnamed protein product [Lactuca virosa]